MQVTQAIVMLLFAETVAGEARSLFYQTAPTQNVIFTNDLLFESPAWTTVQCSLLCLNHVGCVTFTFTDNSTSLGICRGHSSLQESWDQHTAQANTRYFSVAGLAQNCQDMRTLQPRSGVKQLNVNGIPFPVSAYCDQDTDGGGWTVIQRRQNGSVDFNRTWAEYQNGFGDPAGEYWLGLETQHRMTSRQTYEFRVDLQLFNGTTGFAVYNNFSVGSGSDFYRLTIDGYTVGNLYNSISDHNGSNFSTWNSDNDNADSSCAAGFGGGWWYLNCSYVDLNSAYTHNSSCLAYSCVCPYWYGFGPECSNSLQRTAMKIRPSSD